MRRVPLVFFLARVFVSGVSEDLDEKGKGVVLMLLSTCRRVGLRSF